MRVRPTLPQAPSVWLRSLGLAERFRVFLLIATLVAAVALDRDVFSLNTAAGRITLADLFAAAFVAVALTTHRALRPDIGRAGAGVLVGGWLLAISGLSSLIVLDFFVILPNYASGLVDSLRYVLYTLTCLCVLIEFRSNAAAFEVYCACWLVLAILVVLVGVAQVLALEGVRLFESAFLWENIRSENRVASTFRWQGPLVAFLGLVLPLIAWKATRTSGYAIPSFFLLIAVGWAVALFSGSRAAIMVLPLTLVPLVAGARAIRVIIGMLAPLLISFALWGQTWTTSYLQAAPDQFTRAWGHGQIDTFLTAEIRARVWREGYRLWEASPYFGVGPGQLVEYLGFAAHNTFLDIVYERGLLGMSALAVILIAMTALVRRLLALRALGPTDPRRGFRVALAMSAINLGLYSLTAHALSYRLVWLFVPLVIWEATSAPPTRGSGSLSIVRRGGTLRF